MKRRFLKDNVLKSMFFIHYVGVATPDKFSPRFAKIASMLKFVVCSQRSILPESVRLASKRGTR